MPKKEEQNRNGKHPVAVQNGFNGEGSLPALPCDACRAKCCMYFALQIDTPTTKDDFEHIKWYVSHKNVFIFVDGGDWYLQVDNPCEHLGPRLECTIYDRRPKICRDHGYNEDHEPNCEHFQDPNEPLHDAEYHTIEDVERLVARRFPGRKNGAGKRAGNRSGKRRSSRVAG